MVRVLQDMARVLRWQAVAGLAAMAAAACVAASAPRAAPQTSQTFHDLRTAGIYQVSAEGGTPELLFDGFVGRSGVWSPEGERLAYSRHDRRTDQYSVRLYDVRAGQERELLSAGRNRYIWRLVWSPDGRRLAALLGSPGTPERVKLVVLTPEADPPVAWEKDLSQYSWGPDVYSWSPDGRYFALLDSSAGRPEETVLLVLTSEGAAALELALGREYTRNSPIAWSPDSKRLAIVPTRTAQGYSGTPRLDVVTVDAESGEKRPIYTSDDMSGYFNATHLAWSHDGRSLAVSIFQESTEATDESRQVLLVPADGQGEARKVADGLLASSDPRVLSEDGQRLLLWQGDSAESGALSLLDLETGSSTPLGPVNGDITWSLDSQRLAYLHQSRLYVASARRGEPRLVLEVPLDFVDNLAWSADGRYLRFTLDLFGRGLMVRDLESGAERLLVPEGHKPLWSPTGERIAFLGYDFPFFGHLYTVRADGTDLRRLGRVAISDTPGACSMGMTTAWSPDGRYVAYNTEIGESYGEGGVYVAPATGESAPVHLGEGYSPSWSPDGRWVAFSWWDNEHTTCQVVLASPDGRERRVLWEGLSPRWSPDGTRIAFLHKRQLFLGDPGTGEVEYMPWIGVPSDYFCCNMAWSPDGRYLLFNNQLLDVASDRVCPMHGGTYFAITWTPDGQLAFLVRGPDEVERRFTVLPCSDQEPVPLDIKSWAFHWSPDGKKLVYEPDPTP